MVVFVLSQTFHEVISFLYSYVTKMQEGDYDVEPAKEEAKVGHFTFFTVLLQKTNASRYFLSLVALPPKNIRRSDLLAVR